MTPTPPANRRNIILGTVTLSCVFCCLVSPKFLSLDLVAHNLNCIKITLKYNRLSVLKIKVSLITPCLVCQVWPHTPSHAPPRCVTAPSRRAQASHVTASRPGRRVTSGHQPPDTEAGPGSTRPRPGGLRTGWVASVARYLLTLLTLKVSGVWSRLDLALALNFSSRVSFPFVNLSSSFEKWFLVVC